MTEASIVRGACHHDCPDTCVWDATVVDGKVVRLRGNVDHPTTRGELCPKVNRFLDRVYHPDRLLTPLRRSGPKGSGLFSPISWEEAVDETAERLSALVREHGGETVLQFSFDGTQGAIQKGLVADRFFDLLGASDIKRHLCGVTAGLGAADVLGMPYGIDPEDLALSRTILLWGTNTLVTNRHLWASIEAARRNGGTVTVIDPIRTPTAERADDFLQIRPGTDVALVLAMVNVLDRESLVDAEWLAEATTGWEELRADAAAMPPERAASITGIDGARIAGLARRFATETPAAIRVLVGPEHRQHGRDIMRAVAMLPAVTGAWRDPGGGLARSTQIYFETALSYPEGTPRRSFNMARLGEVLTASEVGIRALVVHNSNPAVICPDQNRVIQGLEREDLFTVVLEQFMTDTARHADIVLPVTTQLEQLDLAISWGHLYLALNRPAVAPLGEALPNTDIFRRLAEAMGIEDPLLSSSDETLIRGLLDSSHPWLGGVSYEDLERDTWARLNIPSGYRPGLDPSLRTGPMRLGPLRFSYGDETPEAAPEHARAYPLTLLTRKQHQRFLNANYGGFPEHFPTSGEPRLEIHADDAASRGIGDGDRVVVANERGSLTVAAEISNAVPSGVVSLPFGWWHGSTPEGRGVNALTNASVGPADAGSAHFHETLVEVALAGT